jgi:hypothetical protein
VRASASGDHLAADEAIVATEVTEVTEVTVREDIDDGMLARARRVVRLVNLLLNCENNLLVNIVLPFMLTCCTAVVVTAAAAALLPHLPRRTDTLGRWLQVRMARGIDMYSKLEGLV